MCHYPNLTHRKVRCRDIYCMSDMPTVTKGLILNLWPDLFLFLSNTFCIAPAYCVLKALF